MKNRSEKYLRGTICKVDKSTGWKVCDENNLNDEKLALKTLVGRKICEEKNLQGKKSWLEKFAGK